MYLRRIAIENSGPIQHINYNLPFDENERPKPVIFVGRNGAGKSILLSHIVNTLLLAKGTAFEDGEVASGKVYKIRTPTYTSHGAGYSRSKIELSDGFFVSEFQLDRNRATFEEEMGYASSDPMWDQIPSDDNSILLSNCHERVAELRLSLSQSVMLYFPPNRFEDPAWLNSENLKNVASYLDPKRLKGLSNRTVITQAPMKTNQSWLLDVIYDSFAIERQFEMVKFGENLPLMPMALPLIGPANRVREAVEEFLRKLLDADGPVSWSVGSRGRRNLALNGQDSKPLFSNLFSLSTGQTALLNIFLSIIRDYDLSDATFDSLSEIKGTVIVDEIDLHLHTELQYKILPDLIALFPKIQFILTSHSPLFILGMEKKLGTGGFEIIELPKGFEVDVERFTEFEAAYQYFRESAKFENDIQEHVTESQKPLVFAEGTIDVDYITRAAFLLERESSLSRVKVLQADGCANLDKIWKFFETNLAELTNRRVTLLYDCDVGKSDAEKRGIRRVIFPKLDRRIDKGIENLFPDTLIESAKAANPAFVDVTPEHPATVRGENVTVAETWQINPNEKRNLANWIIAHAEAEDFLAFHSIFDHFD